MYLFVALYPALLLCKCFLLDRLRFCFRQDGCSNVLWISSIFNNVAIYLLLLFIIAFLTLLVYKVFLAKSQLRRRHWTKDTAIKNIAIQSHCYSKLVSSLSRIVLLLVKSEPRSTLKLVSSLAKNLHLS